jgi:THO complex subunit 4
VSSGASAKLIISNLDYGVSDNDIRELFSEFGTLRRSAVHYDRAGRSLGTAEVIYATPRDAQRALTQYNGVPLDGRPMRIQYESSVPASPPPPVRPMARSAPFQRGGGFQRGSMRRPALRGRGGAARRGGRGGAARKPPPTKEELDRQIDEYNAAAQAQTGGVSAE